LSQPTVIEDKELEYCRFGKRNLEKLSWIALLLNNQIGDALNLEMRHQHLFFIRGDQVLDNVGFSEKGRRFNESEFGNEITNFEDLQRHGYWLFGKLYDAAAMREALDRQKDGYYYSIFSNQCQDWTDRLARLAVQVEREWEREGRKLSIPTHLAARADTPLSERLAPTEPASVGMGVFALVLGAAAIATPLIFGGAIAWLFGLYFVAAGISHVIYAFHGRDWRAIVPILFFAILSLATGAVLLLNTQFAVVATSVVLGVFLGGQGAANVFVGLVSKPRSRWAGNLILGIIMVLLSASLFLRWPASGDLFLGIYVGVVFIIGGLGTIYYSYRTRSDPR
jgi:uncharacterized membrane protein HdeD (DUF308 family)